MYGYRKGIDWDCYKLAANTNKLALRRKEGEAEQNRFLSTGHRDIMHKLDEAIKEAIKENNQEKRERLRRRKENT